MNLKGTRRERTNKRKKKRNQAEHNSNSNSNYNTITNMNNHSTKADDETYDYREDDSDTYSLNHQSEEVSFLCSFIAVFWPCFVQIWRDRKLWFLVNFRRRIRL